MSAKYLSQLLPKRHGQQTPPQLSPGMGLHEKRDAGTGKTRTQGLSRQRPKKTTDDCPRATALSNLSTATKSRISTDGRLRRH
jgi:hypothetical protein